MLNPFAHEYTPASAFPPEKQVNKKNNKKQVKKKNVKSETIKKSNEHNKRRSSQPVAATNIFEKESKFITIEAAIDPVHRLDTLFEHGYERYIDWINRSLRIYDTVTIIGMDNAIVDIVSLVTILHDRKIGVHDGKGLYHTGFQFNVKLIDVETFSMETENNRITSCIQVKLHPFY